MTPQRTAGAVIGEDARTFVEAQRVARLASVDEHGRPHVVPICFALDGNILYSVLDAKPKRVEPARLRRVRNILARPDVQVLFDRYDDEDWSRLAFVQLRGRASLLVAADDPVTHAKAIAALKRRYQQYALMRLDAAPVIRIDVEQCVVWGGLQA